MLVQHQHLLCTLLLTRGIDCDKEGRVFFVNLRSRLIQVHLEIANGGSEGMSGAWLYCIASIGG